MYKSWNFVDEIPIYVNDVEINIFQSFCKNQLTVMK